MNRNSAIDTFRLIAAFFIVAIHTNLPDFGFEIGSVIRLSGRWAVPFFFIISGYFLGKKLKDKPRMVFADIEKSVVHLISIFLVSSIIYLIHSVLFSGDWLTNDVKFLFVGTYWHLWFVGSLVFGFLTIWFVHTIGYQRYLPLISVAILLIALFTDSYDAMLGLEINFDEIPVYLISIPFMYIGIFISQQEFKKATLPLWVTLFVMGFVLQFIEAFLLKQMYNISTYYHHLLLGTITATVSLFIICLSVKTKGSYLSLLGEKYSLFIYLYHILGYWIIRKIFAVLGIPESDYTQLISPVICFILTLGGAVLLDKFMPRWFSILNGDIKIRE